MTTRLFCTLVAGALLAPCASAQNPTATPPAPFPLAPQSASQPLPANDGNLARKPDQPNAGKDDKDAPDLLAKIAWFFRSPTTDGPPPIFGDDPAVNRNRIWVNNEFLVWWPQGMSLPPLVSTSPQGTPTAAAGVLGANGSGAILGPSETDDNARLGWRFTVGTWLTDDHKWGVEAQFLILSNSGDQFAASSPGNPILARPVINVATQTSAAEPIAVPGETTGSIRVSTTTSGLVGAGLLFRENFSNSDNPCDTCRLCPLGCGNGNCGGGSGWTSRIDSLFGFRYLRLSDHLEIDDNVNALVPLNGLPAGSVLQRIDRFDTYNNFYGIDLGVSGDYSFGPISIGTLAKIALGFNNASLDVSGGRTVNGAFTGGGLLAETPNIGHFVRTTASAVPEIGAKLAYHFTPNIEVSAGYSYLYLYHVVRAANQVNPEIDPAFLANGTPTGATPTQPGLAIQERSMWVQGVSFGFLWRY